MKKIGFVIIGALIVFFLLNNVLNIIWVDEENSRVIYRNTDETRTFDRANINYNNGNYKKSFIIVEDLLTENPEHIDGIILKASIYKYMGNYPKAIQVMNSMDELIKKHGDNIQLFQYYSMYGFIYESISAYEGTKYADKAIEYLEKAIETLDEFGERELGWDNFRQSTDIPYDG